VVVSSLLPSLHFTVAAVIAGILATAVEFVKLYRTPAINAFRLTFPGIVMPGRLFSFLDIAAY
jgi:hypothetical protein